MRRIIIAVFIIVLFLILISACRPGDQAAPCRHTDVDNVRPTGEQIERRGETDPFLPGFVWVQKETGDEAARTVDGQVVDLADPARVADLLNDWHCPGDNRGLTSDDLASAVETEAWLAVVGAADLVALPEQLPVTAALDILRDFEPLPVQLLGTANHWGAMPGVLPVGAGPNANEVPEAAPADGGPSVVAIVDTGFYGHQGIIKGAGLDDLDSRPDPGSDDELSGRRQYGRLAWLLHRIWQAPVEQIDDYRSGSAICDVSHGEFVADIMRQVDPGVTLYGFNAFPARLGKDGEEARCWETSELAVAFTIARMEASGVQFDAVNMSLGTYAHDGGNQPVTMPALEALLGETAPDWAGVIYASSGNQAERPETVGSPVYPAAYPSVTGVGVLAENGDWVVWDEDGKPVASPVADAPPWAWLVTPGCHLMGRGGPDPEVWQVWSGSSFASPLAAIHGLVGVAGGGTQIGLDYDEIASSMVLPADGGPIADPRHCPRAVQIG